ncbi:MAG: ATP-dependent DNA helicase PcrA [Ruminococcaceae bacterium]|nr:ATP-dependent DNA helicase PcrA [Oscillospiraceae bacterium]
MAENLSLNKEYLLLKRRLFDKYYSFLNNEQREAVYTTEGSVLILAGAGSGKTTVLVNRIVFIVKYGNAYYSTYVPHDLNASKIDKLKEALLLDGEALLPYLNEFVSAPCLPWQMLAFTFTNKAANEIKKRLAEALGNEDAAKNVWAGTFHSICVRILRTYGGLLGYRDNFTIYDADESKKAISAVMKSLNIDEKLLSAKTVASEISRAKDKLITPEDYELEFAVDDIRKKKISKIYAEYQKNLMQSNALDFDDIIMQTVFLLRQNEEVREYYQNKFRYVSVDEFQDTNLAQFELISLLSGGHKNIMAVGDDNQSIYKFRGAVIENILGFDKRFAGTKVIKLEQNYRSTSIILDAANAIIANNVHRKEKNLWTARKGGADITLRCCDDQNYEARYLVEKIQSLVSEGKYKYSDMAILYRANAQSNTIERTFAKSGVPYRMYGGLRFNDRKEIRDAVAYLQFIVNPSDSERMKRIINEPRRGIGAKTIEGVCAIANENLISVFEVLKNADKYVALSRSAQKLIAFADLISYFRNMLYEDISLERFVNTVIDKSGYRQMLIDGGEEEKERLENIAEFISGIGEYENAVDNPSLLGFLEENSLVADVDDYDESADAVVMMTIHSAKGLEFPIVFLPGMEEGVFPGTQVIFGGEMSSELEEERRLAYVAVTRAKDMLYIVHTKMRMLYGKTGVNELSRFVKEIPKELIKEEKRPSAQYGGNPYRNQTQTYGTKVYFSEHTEVKTSNGFAQGKPEIFAVGDRVRHATFGEGEVFSAKPMGNDVLYEVVFERVGTKKLMGNFARMKKVN